jgi:hypothetical protein
MVALANSNGRQDSLKTQLSEAVALGRYKLTDDESASKAFKADAKELSSSPAATGLTPKSLSKKELKKAKEAEHITEDDDNLNRSVEELINSTEHPLVLGETRN